MAGSKSYEFHPMGSKHFTSVSLCFAPQVAQNSQDAHHARGPAGGYTQGQGPPQGIQGPKARASFHDSWGVSPTFQVGILDQKRWRQHRRWTAWRPRFGAGDEPDETFVSQGGTGCSGWGMFLCSGSPSNTFSNECRSSSLVYRGPPDFNIYFSVSSSLCSQLQGCFGGPESNAMVCYGSFHPYTLRVLQVKKMVRKITQDTLW